MSGTPSLTIASARPERLTSRLAIEDDLPELRSLMARAINQLQADLLSPTQIAASHAVMGLDTRLVSDRTYFVVEADGALAGCGGWSRRATLYGGDHTVATRDDALLEAGADAARVRAMYTDPAHARLGVGRLILDLSEAAARTEGFLETELMATLAGERLYAVCGYAAVERTAAEVDGVAVPLVRMRKAL